MVLADELEADWTRVKIVQAQGDAKYGDQNTDGSRSTWQFYQPMREAGAAARQMLEAAAAQIWNVKPADCHAQKALSCMPRAAASFLWRTRQTRRDDAGAAYKQLRSRTRKDWRYIGKPRSDRRSSTTSSTGRAIYGIDVVVTGHEIRLDRAMPRLWREGQIVRFQGCACGAWCRERRRDPRQHRFRPDSNPLAALPSSPTIPGRRSRAATSSRLSGITAPMSGHDSTAYRAELEATAKRARQRRAQPRRCRRRPRGRQPAGSQPIISSPTMRTRPMEVPAAVARFEGGTCEIFAPTQDPPRRAQNRCRSAERAGSGCDDQCHSAGGAFGRKSKPDFIAEAAVLARQIGAPVKVTWTREDEIRNDYLSRHLRPASRGRA